MAPHKLSARRALKHVLAGAAWASGSLDTWRLLRRLARGPEVRIYGYHRIVSDARRAARATMPPLSTSLRSFAIHLDHLTRRYEVVSLEAAAAMLAGTRPFPRRPPCVITFDDGYRDVLEHAAPLLCDRRVPATMFVSTAVLDAGRPLLHDRVHALMLRARRAREPVSAVAVPPRARWALARADAALQADDPLAASEAILAGLARADVERVADLLAARLGEPRGEEVPPCLDWDGVGRLAAYGVTIEAHTETHAHLPLEPDDVVVRELEASREAIARATGRAPAALAYPAGRYDDRVLALARRCGYRIGVTTEDRPNRPGDDLLRLGRKMLSDAHGLGLFGLSPSLVAAQLDGLFSALRLSRPVSGTTRLEEPLFV